jgi:DNA (cytosine-5)-methyltransferase 1
MTNFTYKWNLADLAKVEKNGLNVFSCFACGGGSTMGYKMSGFEVIGANEIDPEMAQTYKINHNPKHLYLEDIRKFRTRDDLPKELYNLDILDGSPPCSSFSIAGSREKGWGKKKVFREGQADQTLDDLFFDFIELGRKLQPKVIVAENVKGMLQGNAKGYVKQINGLFKVSGYDVQLFLLNGATMGLPQKRERVFFVARRRDLNLPKLKIGFNERPIPLRDAFKGVTSKGRDKSSSKNHGLWKKCKPGNALSSVHPKGSLFNWAKWSPNKPAPTLTSHAHLCFHWDSMREFSVEELSLVSSFPLDYKFKSENLAGYQMGMSVPPLMTHKLSEQIFKQWFQNATT